MIGFFRNRPDKIDQLKSYEQSTKQAAVASLLTDERIIDESMEVAMQKMKMDLHRSLDRIRIRLTAIRHSLESAPLLIYPDSALKPTEVINNIATFHVAVVYQTFAIEAAATRLRDEFEDDPDIDSKPLVRDIRNTSSALESIWNLRPKTAMNEQTSKALKEQLKSVNKGVVDIIEKVSDASQAQVELAFKEVAMKKPKLFGKGKYRESLGDLMVGTIKSSGLTEMGLVDIRDKMIERFPGIDLNIKDMEEAVKNLHERKLIFGVREEANTQVIQIRKLDKSPKCGKCGKEGGFMIDYYTCPITDGFVCGDCISFFGKCKVCGKKIKLGHELVK
ncbi:MAG: hypothetical protein ACXAC7_15060 [Candidatus Hodarchaeales archaeon]|jgi:hypothetical protein